MAEQQPAGTFKDTDAYNRYLIDEYGGEAPPPNDPSDPTGLTGIAKQLKDEIKRRQENG